MRIVYSKTTYRNALYQACIAIIIGLVLVIWPHIALKSIVRFIGVLFLVSGIMAMIISYRRQKLNPAPETVLSLNGVGSLLLGILLVSVPLPFTALLMFILGVVLILGAIAQLVTLLMARQLGYTSPVSYFFPIIVLLAGLVVIFKPWGSAEYIVVILGVTAIFYGVTDLISQYNINRFRKQYEQEHQQNLNNGGEIEDADYEEVEDVDAEPK